MFFVADKDPVVFESLNRLRLHFRDRLGLADPDVLAICWVTDFPLFEWNEEEGRIEPMHHMFTMPREEDLPLLDSDPCGSSGSSTTSSPTASSSPRGASGSTAPTCSRRSST